MFTKNPILSGVALMMVSFVAFMAQASIEYTEDSVFIYQTVATAQEVKKEKKNPKVCAKNLEKQRQEIADKLKEIKKELKKLKK